MPISEIRSVTEKSSLAYNLVLGSTIDMENVSHDWFSGHPIPDSKWLEMRGQCPLPFHAQNCTNITLTFCFKKLKIIQMLYLNQDSFWEKVGTSLCKGKLQEAFVTPHPPCLVRGTSSKQDKERSEVSGVSK